MANILMDAKAYARIGGIALAATALLGIVVSAVNDGAFIGGFLDFDWTHNVVHVLLAAVALFVGFSSAGQAYAMTYAKVLGVVYSALGVLGFVPAVRDLLDDLLGLHLELGENLVHLALGAWGIMAGFFGAPMTARPTGMPARRA